MLFAIVSDAPRDWAHNYQTKDKAAMVATSECIIVMMASASSSLMAVDDVIEDLLSQKYPQI